VVEDVALPNVKETFGALLSSSFPALVDKVFLGEPNEIVGFNSGDLV
jgi:hypothetical protein